jgi:hypothetical protein
MKKQWAQTKSGPFPEAICASMKDLRKRLESRDEMSGEKGRVGDGTENMEEVCTPPNDTNDDMSHLVLNDGGTSTSPIPFPLAARDTGSMYVTPIECTTDLTPTIPIKSNPAVPIVTPSAPVTSTIMFYGDECEGEDPQQFLYTFRADMLHFAVTDNQKITNAFVDYLGTDSTANFWYHNLPQAI